MNLVCAGTGDRRRPGQDDPAAHATWRYLQAHAPLRPGERATLFRFWMAADTYQAVSPVQSQVFIQAVNHYLTTPGLAYTFFPCAEADFWAPVLAYADLARLTEADFEVGGRRYGVYGHDWRAVPPAAWLTLLGEREVGAGLQASARARPWPSRRWCSANPISPRPCAMRCATSCGPTCCAATH